MNLVGHNWHSKKKKKKKDVETLVLHVGRVSIISSNLPSAIDP